jgi:hypothetical protein
VRDEVVGADLNINAVEMVRAIREAHYEKIKDLSTKDKIEFFREKARALHVELGLSEKLPAIAVQSGRSRWSAPFETRSTKRQKISRVRN